MNLFDTQSFAMPEEHRLSPVIPLLQKFEDHGFSAYVGGGALRDMTFNKPMRDVDIFVMPCRGLLGVTYPPNQKHLYEILGAYPTFSRSMAYVPGDVLEHFIYEGDGDGPPLNIIVMKRPMTCHELAHRMDFGICQIVLGADNVCTVTPYWAMDVQAKTFTVVHLEREDHSMRRWERIKERYPEFSVVVPSRLILPN